MLAPVKYIVLSSINSILQNKLLEVEVESLFKQIRQRELQRLFKNKYLLIEGKYNEEAAKAFLFLYYEIYDRKKHSAVQSAMYDIKVNVKDILENFSYWEDEFLKFHVTLTKKTYVVAFNPDLTFSRYGVFRKVEPYRRTKSSEVKMSSPTSDNAESPPHEQTTADQ